MTSHCKVHGSTCIISLKDYLAGILRTETRYVVTEADVKILLIVFTVCQGQSPNKVLVFVIAIMVNHTWKKLQY